MCWKLSISLQMSASINNVSVGLSPKQNYTSEAFFDLFFIKYNLVLSALSFKGYYTKLLKNIKINILNFF